MPDERPIYLRSYSATVLVGRNIYVARTHRFEGDRIPTVEVFSFVYGFIHAKNARWRHLTRSLSKIYLYRLSALEINYKNALKQVVWSDEHQDGISDYWFFLLIKACYRQNILYNFQSYANRYTWFHIGGWCDYESLKMALYISLICLGVGRTEMFVQHNIFSNTVKLKKKSIILYEKAINN